MANHIGFQPLTRARRLNTTKRHERKQHSPDQIIDKIKTTNPDIIFVVLGAPKQERLIAILRSLLPQAWWLGVGISFSFLAGDVRRAPVWMQRVGLEWSHRLAQEPRRLARRYLVHGIPFMTELIMRALGRRIIGSRLK